MLINYNVPGRSHFLLQDWNLSYTYEIYENQADLIGSMNFFVVSNNFLVAHAKLLFFSSDIARSNKMKINAVYIDIRNVRYVKSVKIMSKSDHLTKFGVVKRNKLRLYTRAFLLQSILVRYFQSWIWFFIRFVYLVIRNESYLWYWNWLKLCPFVCSDYNLLLSWVFDLQLFIFPLINPTTTTRWSSSS